MLEEKISSIKEKTEIVALPEMFNTGFSMQPELLAESMEGETVQWMKRITAEKKIILTGSFICKEDHPAVQAEVNEGEVQTEGSEDAVQTPAAARVPTRYYNRLVWMLPNGQYGVYDKRHRFAFAGEDRQFSAGSKRLIASVKGWKINLQVCYDLRFPVWARQAPSQPHHKGEEHTSAEYDVLIYVANWPEKRSHAWKTLLQARAIENQCYVVGVNRVGNDGNGIYHSGDSMAVDPMGEVLCTKKDAEDIFTVVLDKEHLRSVREKLPFLRDADDFMLLNEEE